MKRKPIRSLSTAKQAKSRQGATVLETALTMMIFLSLVLGMLDLGMGVLRHQQLTDAARFAARSAAVHGELADRLGNWGTTGITGNASDGSPVGNLFAQRMVGNHLDKVNFTIDWMDGGNDVRDDHRVRVIATVPYTPIITFILGSPTFTLQTVSILPIAH